jgi:hypothetical protein
VQRTRVTWQPLNIKESWPFRILWRVFCHSARGVQDRAWAPRTSRHPAEAATHNNALYQCTWREIPFSALDLLDSASLSFHGKEMNDTRLYNKQKIIHLTTSTT